MYSADTLSHSPPLFLFGERIDYNKGIYLISLLTIYQYSPPTYQLSRTEELGSSHDKCVHNPVISVDPLDTTLSSLLLVLYNSPDRSHTLLDLLEGGGRGTGVELHPILASLSLMTRFLRGYSIQ